MLASVFVALIAGDFDRRQQLCRSLIMSAASLATCTASSSVLNWTMQVSPSELQDARIVRIAATC